MNKIKNICKNTLSYIATRRLLRYSIIIIIILLPVGTILKNKYLNIKENNIEKIEEQVSDKNDTNKDVANGTINTDAFIDKEVSKHTLSGGYSTLSDDYVPNSHSNTGNKNNISHTTSQNIDKSSISGINLEILEGYEFNPRKDLKLQATDKDGSNISDSIIIEKNTVNTTIPGIYSVKASVRLSNGQSKEKEFTIIVKETRLDVSLGTFKPVKANIKKGEKIGFELDLKVSKKHVNPVAVMLNGQEYTLHKGNENIIDVLTNTKNYKVFINAEDTSGIYEYNLEHVKMSNGAWISLGENITSVEVLKSEACINNFNYQENSESKEVEVKFDLNDTDNTAFNLILEFYKDNSLLESIKLDRMVNYSMNLPVSSNGIYNLKILSDINLNQDMDESNIIKNKVIFDTSINVSNIDQTSITGNNIEINQGDNFDFIKDLDLKATDFDGEDITDKIEIDGNNIDVNVEGKQSIIVYIVNKHGIKYTKKFNVTVNPIKKSEFSLSRILSNDFIKNKARSSNSRFSSSTIITADDTESLNHRVEVSGIVSKSDGSIPQGKIQVELPTAMAFTVDQKGNFKSADYIVNNKSSVDISVSVVEFRSSTNNNAIIVKPINEDISKLDRSNLHLALVGNKGRYLDLGDSISGSQELLTIKPSSSGLIQLLGESGKVNSENVDKNGASDEFTLIFNIKKI